MSDLISRASLLEAIERTFPCDGAIKHIVTIEPSVDAVPATEFQMLRNENCINCGLYKHAHEGACDMCRWR